MKVLMLMKTMRMDGGVETSVAVIINELTVQGHDVYLASFTEKEAVDLVPRLDIPHDRIIHLGKIKLNYISKIYSLRKILKTHNFDILHTHLFHAGVVGRISAIGLRCSTVATEHSTFFNWWKWYHYLIDKILAHRTDAHIAVSRSVAATLAARTGILPNKIHVINNAVDHKRFRFHREQKTLDRLGLNILLVGRLEYSKNIEFAIKVVKGLLAYDPSITLNISGAGSQKNALIDMCKREGVIDNVIFIGITDNMQNVMNKMDFLFLSSHWEGCPMTIIEAFSVGLPVIATAVPGIFDIIDNKITGILVEPENVSDAIEKIYNFMRNENMQSNIIANAVLENKRFFAETITSRIVKLYKSILKS